MNKGKICVSVFAATTEALTAQIRKAEPLADIIELRFDHLEPLEIDKFIAALPATEKKYLFTFRPRSEGGKREVSPAERRAFWSSIHSKLRDIDYLVDYEADLELPAGFDPDRIVISSHDFSSGGPDPAALFARLSTSDAGIIKIAQDAGDITGGIPVWALLEKARTKGKHLVPIVMGEAGKWTRILGLAHGAYMTYASLESGSETASGQITAGDLIGLYRVKELDLETDVYGILAGDTSYSMSPYIHNPAFKARKINAVFVPLQVSDLASFIRRMVDPRSRETELNFKGFSVTNPHKQSILENLSSIDDDASAIGAVNTVKLIDGNLYGYNTDAEGFISPLLRSIGDLKGSRSAVFGAGGAARACVHMLKKYGSDVTVFGRDIARTQGLTEKMGVAAASLPAVSFSDFDIVVNATPLGTKGAAESETIATAEQLAGVKLVYDLIYNPSETKLSIEARKAGAAFIGGLEMLVQQGAKQFELWTGQSAPIEEMRAAACRRLGL